MAPASNAATPMRIVILPFTHQAFFDLFGRYNEAIWPLVFIAYCAGTASVILLLKPNRVTAFFISSILAAMWLVNGVGYHWMFFRTINPVAGIFGAAFAIQSILLVLRPVMDSDLRFYVQRDARSVAGLSLMIFAMILYPAWGWLGHLAWPKMPAFGVAPCPTTIFTIGMLLLGPWRSVCWLLIIPSLWATIGGSAAILLDVSQDIALFAALALTIFFSFARWNGMHLAQHSNADDTE